MKKLNKRLACILAVIMMFAAVGCNAVSEPAQNAGTATEAPAAETVTEEAKPTEAPNEGYKISLGKYPLIGEPTHAPEASQSSDEEITLTIWMSPMWTVTDESLTNGATATLEEFLQESLGRFAASYTGAKIVDVVVENVPGKDRDEKLAVAKATDSLPDMIYESFFAVSSLAHEGLFIPVDAAIDETAKVEISESIWNQVQINNETYCYPFTQGLNYLAYNADMFKECGLDKYIAGENELAYWTTDEYTEILTALHEKYPEISPFIIGCVSANGDTWLLSYLRAQGGEWFDANGNIIADNPTTVEGLQYLLDLKEEGLINSNPESIQATESREQFVNQLCGIGLMANANFNSFKGKMNDGSLAKFDMRPAYVFGTRPSVTNYIHGFSAFNTADEVKMQASLDFIKWINSDDAFLAESRWLVPVRDNIFEQYADFDPMFPAYKDAAQYSINFYNNSPAYTQLRNVLYPQMQAAFTGMKTAQEALSDYTDEANEILKKGKQESVALNR